MKKIISVDMLKANVPYRKPGYLDDVLSNSKKISDTHVEMDEATYERIRQQYGTGKVATEIPGPGTELKKLLASIGIHATPTCKCNTMARKMNEWGPEESMKHIEEIVDVMEETAKKRGLPFIRLAGKAMVRLACWRARKGNGS